MQVSVIVPVYNIIEYLERCVNSLTSQTYRDLEIILVDDGSTDGSGELCDELTKKDERIRVFYQENAGSSAARNKGIKAAKGEYISFVDSDDYVNPDFIEKMIEAAIRHNAPMAQISRDEIDENGNRLADVCEPPKEEIIITAHDQMRELLLHKGDCSFCTRITHRSLFGLASKGDSEAGPNSEGKAKLYPEGAGLRLFPEGVLNEDFRLMINMLTATDGLPKLEEYPILPDQAYHVFYRMGSNSRKKDSNEFSRVFSDIVDNADYVESIIDDAYPDLKNIARRFALFQRLDYMLHIPVSMMNKSNEFYKRVVRYLRKHFSDTLFNRHLTAKNRIYLVLLTIAPRFVRKVHQAVRK